MPIMTSFLCQNNGIILNDDITKNTIIINSIDYYAYSVSPLYKRNKGAHSFVFALYPCQDFVDINSSMPQKVIKISNKPDFYRGNKLILRKDNERFRIEINALKACKEKHIENIIEIDLYDHLICKDKDGKNIYFPFYMMDYADSDLKQYLETHIDIEYSERLNLCLQLAAGLNDLNKLGFYHRDIKPDNILIFSEQQWKIGDLGLVSHRNADFDKINELIGPKGWLSPEAMNKYLTEGLPNCKFDCRIDDKSDIFQLGKVFWYILQGNAPIGCLSRSDFMGNDDIYVLIRTMLNHSKRKRIQSMDYVVSELKRIIDKNRN